MYLLDTNIVSEARRKSPEAIRWLQSVEPHGLYLSVLTLGEIARGIALKAKTDQVAAGHLTEWLQRLRNEHSDRILPVSERVAIEWGRLSALRPRGDIDGLIAATAIVHDLIVVTRNVSDFDGAGVQIVNPWA